MDESTYRGGLYLDPLPPPNQVTIHLVRIRKGEQRDFVILSKSLWGVWVHWSGARSEPCHAEKSECPGCKRGHPRRWKGYLHAVTMPVMTEVFVELTPLAAESLNVQMPPETALRGYRLTLKRSQGASNGRLTVIVNNPHPALPKLPEPKDPYTTLAKLWGLDQSLANGNGCR